MAATAPAIPYEGVCDLPISAFGYSLKTRLFPSVIVFTLAIGWYYLNGLFFKGGTTALYAVLPFFFVIVLAGAQSYVIMKQPQCPPVPWWGILVAWVFGIASGTIGYWSAWAATGKQEGSGGIVPIITTRQSFTTEHFNDTTNSFIFSDKPTTNLGVSTSGIGSVMSSSGKEQCTAPSANADQTFVVDLYKNGKLITQAIGE
jgi:hypothetical protein